ncbi:hypothetical protein CKO36_14945 [Rhabdochromatium marinum]|nr:hypothetical protein [Rhabdochromatium marinum]
MIARLQAENASLREALSASQAALTDAHETIAQLRARIDELERRLGLNSGNSGTPPVERWAEETHSQAHNELARALKTQAGRTAGAPG